jgi:cell shape-determining protein MreC
VLSIQLPAAVSAAPNMPVAYPYGLVGRLEVVGLGAARVRLITDKGSRISGEFVRYHKDTGSFEHLPQLPKIVEGTGDGRMIIKSVKAEEASPPKHPEQALAVGDWVIVKDKDLTAVQGLKLGEIEEIVDSRQALFKNIVLRPDQDLMKLREVMVMVRK